MNAEQAKSLIRSILVLLCGGTLGVFLVKHGITVDDNFLTMATGLIFGVVSLAWSQFTHATPSA